MTLEELKVIINADSTKFNKNISGAKQTLNQFGQSAGRVGAVLASVLSVGAVVKFSQACVELGSNLSEVQNVVDTTFGSMSGQLDAWAQNAAETFGLSETMAKQYSSTLGTMAKSMGFTTAEAYEMGTTLAGLSGDIASFYNIDQDTAFTKLKAIFTGETEGLKSLGVVMTETALEQYALSQGITTSVKKMTEAEKVSLRYQYVLKNLSAASGDFAKTSNGWANQVRILQLRFDSIRATIGQGLINALTPVLQLLNRMMAALQVVSDKFRNFTVAVFGNAGGIGTTSALENAAGATSLIASNLESASNSAEAVKKSLFGFDEINTLGSSSESEADTSAGVVTAEDTISQVGFAAEESEVKLTGFAAKIQKLLEVINPLAGAVGKGFLDFWIGVKDNIEAIANSELVGGILDNLTKWLGDIDTDDAEKFGTILGEISAIILAAGFATTLSSVVANLQTLSTIGAVVVSIELGWGAGSFIAELLGYDSVSMSDFISELVQEAVDGALGGNLIGFVSESFSGFFSTLLEDVLSGNIVNTLVEWRRDIVNAWLEIFGLSNSPISKAINKFYDYVKKKFDQIKNDMVGIGKFIGTIVTTGDVKKAYDAAIKYLSSTNSTFKKLYDISYSVMNSVVSAIDKVKTSFSGLSKTITSTFNTCKSNITSKMSEAFGTVRGMWNGLSTVFANVFKAAVNVAIDKINTMIDRLNASLNFSYPGLNIGGRQVIGAMNIQIANLKHLNKLATGGITTGPTTALIGEAGREAVLPLDRNTGWMDGLVEKLTDAMMDMYMSGVNGSGSGMMVQNTIKVGEATLARTVSRAQASQNGRYSAVAAV